MASKFNVDRTLFPFEPHYQDIDDHRVHFVDEGEGPVLLMLHGNPSWSFVYRKLILQLRGRHRCIAVDYPGYGLSVPAAGTVFSPRRYSEIVEALVERLDLRDVTVFCQDWAGPSGLGFAGRRPEKVRALVIGNTFAWPLVDDKRVRRFSGLMGGIVGRMLAFSVNGVVRFFLREGIRGQLSRAERAMYLAPFSDRAMRAFTWQAPRALIGAADYLSEVEAGLARLKDKPTLLAWAGKDFAFGDDYLERFRTALPNHEVLRLPKSGHFWQDDAAQDVAPAIAALSEQISKPRPGSSPKRGNTRRCT